MFLDDPGVQAEICRLLEQGKKIEAIQQYREHTGASLVDAKEAIEALEREQKAALREKRDPDGSLESRIVTLLERGEKIQAVALYRDETGVRLKDAKDAVEAIAVKHKALHGGRAGCLGTLLFFVAVILAAFAAA
jgi:ribosomal protein L7/L12